ncbi:MAG: alpha/beta hydrolase domain-containing protein [Rhodospirillales bacterium]
MITNLAIASRAPLVGGALFGASGAYDRIEGTATGTLDPAHPANRRIALLGMAPRNAAGLVEYTSDFVLLTPTDSALGNGRLLYEVNNRGRIMMIHNLCAGIQGNRWETPTDLGNALPLRLGFSLLWTGWDPGAPKATGLGLDVPIIRNLTKRIREEFVSGTRLGIHATFKLAYEAASTDATVTVRRTQIGAKTPVAFAFADNRTIRLLPEGTAPTIGSIYEIHYDATKPRPNGIGFAATRDIVSHLRQFPVGNRRITHTLAFGISQAGRYLRDHIAQGFNTDENGARVFDGVLSHVAGIGRVFHNTPFAQPFRTRTWHEDHDFPEIEFPFAAAATDDPLTGRSGALLCGNDSDPKLIETNTSTEYWQKGASLLHTDPLGHRDIALPANARAYLIPGTQHGGKAGMPRDNGPCVNPRNWHDPMPAVRALLVALDEWVTTGREPPPSRVPTIADGTLVPASQVAFPTVHGLTPPDAANDVSPLTDWTNPKPAPRAYGALVPQVGPDGNEVAGIRLPDIAVPRGLFAGWNLYKEPHPAGELADRDGTFLAFTAARLATLQPNAGDRAAVAQALLQDRLLLAEDAAAYEASSSSHP